MTCVALSIFQIVFELIIVSFPAFQVFLVFFLKQNKSL